MRVPCDEPAGLEVFQEVVELLEARSDVSLVDDAVDHAFAVGVGLQSAQAPDAGVAEGAIAEGARLFRQRRMQQQE